MINIFLYTDSLSQSFEINKLKSFLTALNFHTENRGDFLSFLKLDNESADNYHDFLDKIKITDIEKPLDYIFQNSHNTVLSEKFDHKNFFDGYWLQRKWYSYLSEMINKEIGPTNLHFVISGKLFGTFGSKRYHARVLLTGEPAVVSTSGIVEAPARPREYYFAKANLIGMGKGTGELDEIYKDKFVEYDDPKINDILCSYSLQLIKSKITGNPFCNRSDCCLYNSHWQEEVLTLQYRNVMCDECREILENG